MTDRKQKKQKTIRSDCAKKPKKERKKKPTSMAMPKPRIIRTTNNMNPIRSFNIREIMTTCRHPQLLSRCKSTAHTFGPRYSDAAKKYNTLK